ncbi:MULTISPECIES: alpha-L-fucosidase [Streptomyces]|uniref:alpha-L-fucosidase n=1 Tax=Streptomyces koelreuteriae TaxID=2838015 RepID=A0ABX8FKA7_9ACTN|nr:MULTISPECIES: alpha-L-fucosidase [Streptomyces]QWB21543.1 alpha-L-fucosidase [Streptomyces koelreuteriae]UUA04465.1 alpha-L-fucosidase [Streptomyces koelreuteriae]UUA12090.1 alpha-L-fucosidase [Streptomyces sp. CRCS-T-1]
MPRSSINRRQFLASATCVAAAAGAAGAFGAGGAQAASRRYTPDWASVDRHPPAPEWFKDAKFGVYFHWGAFSVPAYDSEWYPRNMYADGSNANKHHIATYGNPSAWPFHHFIDGARDRAGNTVRFAPKLKSEGGNFDPEEWAQLFVDAGARFAGPVAEHHDGFSMWDSQVNEWNSVDKGPRLDLLRIFTTAIRAKGIKLLVAMHHAYNYNGYFEHAPAQTDPGLKKLYGQLSVKEENQLWYDKLKEVIDRAEPDILWQDFKLDAVDETQRLNFLAYYYNQAIRWGREVVATYKDGMNGKGEVFDYERGGPADLTAPYWLTDDSISSNSWCHTQNIGYYSTRQMLHSFIDRVSKNGNMLLNIAPKADGTVPQVQKDILLGIGDHLKRFGESVYSTRAWTAYGEGPTKMGGGSFTRPTAGTAQDIRFTRNKANTVLYATVLGWPGSSLTVTTLNTERIDLSSLTSVKLLGSTAGTYTDLPKRTQDASGLTITLPSSAPYSAEAYVLKLAFSGRIPGLRPSAGAVGYREVNHSGVAAVLPVGDYTADDLTAAGLGPRTLSSLRLAPGYQVIGWSGDHFTGRSWTFTADNADLRGTGGNDRVTSLKVQFRPSTYFRVINVTDGLALDSGGDVASGSDLKQWSWDGSDNLRWQALEVGGGYYKLVNRANGMVADGWGATTDGSAARQAVWNGGNNQQWTITHRGDGRYSIANRTTGLVLDGGGTVPSGSVTKQWTYGNSTNLLWTFTAL